MIKTKLGFSLIEILVVLSIILIIGGISFSNMDFFLKKNSLDNKIIFIKNQKQNFDSKLGKTITDYKIFFEENKEIYAYENTFSKENIINYTSTSNTGTIKIDCNDSQNYFVKIYREEKLYLKDFLFCNQNLSFPLDGNYKILSDKLNNIYVFKFIDQKELSFAYAQDKNSLNFNNIIFKKDLSNQGLFQDKNNKNIDIKILNFGNFEIFDF